MKNIKKVFFDELEGLTGRFRDEDYTVLPEERQVIDTYVDNICSQVTKNGEIGAEDFQMIVKIIEVCERTMDPGVLEIVQDIYWKLDQLDLNKQER